MITQTTTTDELEEQVRERLSKLSTPLQVAEMQLIDSNYRFLQLDEPDLDDDKAKRRVLVAWLEKQGE